MNSTTLVNVEEREIPLSNLDKVLWPQEGYTKGDLIDYYVRVAPYMLGHLHNRPLVFTRYPDGIGGKHFYQKNAPDYLPEWINTFTWVSDDGSANHHILAEDRATLAWLGNQACLEIHTWLSNSHSILNPDYVVFDLDPSEGSTWQNVVDIALTLKNILDQLGLKGYLKTSGAEGLHIYLPIVAKYSYEEARSFAGKIAELVCAVLPDIATIERTVSKRGSKVYVDYMQNVVGKTLCAPYSVRPRAGAPVSTPLHWEEIEHISPGQFSIKTVFDRLQPQGDLFRPVLQDKQNLDEVMKGLGLASR